MPSPRLALVLAALTTAPSVACARVRVFQADTVTSSPGGAWIAGTEGVAAFSDGTSVMRHDYPLTRGAPSWGYDPFTIPAAHVVIAGGQIWLFTRAADVLRWTGSGWSTVATTFPRISRDTPVQLDFALAAPDGSVLVQLHSDRLLWSPPGPPGAPWREERAPHYFEWLRFEGGVLYGLGYRGGSERALFRRTAREQWDVVAPLGHDIGEPRGLIRIPEGPLAVVTNAGLLLIEDGRAPRFVPIDDLATGQHPTARAAILAVAAGGEIAPMPAPSVAPPPAPAAAPPAPAMAAARPLSAPAAEARPPPAPSAAAMSPQTEPRPMAQIAADAPAQPAQTSPSSWVTGVLEAPGHGPLLTLGGRSEGVLEITAKEVRVMPCARSPAFVGAIATPLGLRLVTQKAGLVAVSPGRPCTQTTPPAIRDEPAP